MMLLVKAETECFLMRAVLRVSHLRRPDMLHTAATAAISHIVLYCEYIRLECAAYAPKGAV